MQNWKEKVEQFKQLSKELKERAVYVLCELQNAQKSPTAWKWTSEDYKEAFTIERGYESLYLLSVGSYDSYDDIHEPIFNSDVYFNDEALAKEIAKRKQQQAEKLMKEAKAEELRKRKEEKQRQLEASPEYQAYMNLKKILEFNEEDLELGDLL